MKAGFVAAIGGILDGLLAIAAIAFSSRNETPSPSLIAYAARLLIWTLMVGLIDFELALMTGYLGYQGPANAVWLIGVPAGATSMACRGNVRRSLLLFPCVTVAGLAIMWILAIDTGIDLY
jgi:hypothetical protein